MADVVKSDSLVELPEAEREPDVVVGEVARDTPCARCNTPLKDSYFEVNGHGVCPACRQGLAGSTSLAIVSGLAAAAASVGAYYGIWWLMQFRFSLVAVIAGVAIGWAVRRGASASQSVGYRWLALGLTYLAVVFTYAHSVLELDTSLTLPEVLRISFTLPLSMLVEAKNLVTLILLAFGLHEAWQFAGPPVANIEGPLRTR